MLWGRESILPKEPIFVISFDESKCMGEHYHDFYEIEYIRSGEGYHIINGEKHRVGAGDVFFTNIGSSHYFETTFENPIIVYNCVFNQSALDGICEGFNKNSAFGELRVLPENMNRPYAYLYDSNFEIKDILDKMLCEYANKSEGYLMQITGLLLMLLTSFSRKYGGFHEENGKHQEQLYEVKRHIKEHFRDEINLDDLARIARVHPNYLCRIFKDQVGISISKYIQNVRINYAAMLLRDSNISISYIMSEVGYNNEKYFREIFKDKIGKSPQQYRTGIKKGW